METWKIRQIFDGDYGCEERLPGQRGNNMEHITRDEVFTLLKNTIRTLFTSSML